MEPISSINPRGRIGATPEVVKGASPSNAAATAAKVSRMVKLPVVQAGGLKGRQVKPLDEAVDLSSRIKTQWDALTPEELADRIIDLEDKVALLKGSSPEVAKVRRVAEDLHFKFVHPVALELETSEKAIPISFAKRVMQASRDIFKSPKVFEGFNQVQRQEVLRKATGRL